MGAPVQLVHSMGWWDQVSQLLTAISTSRKVVDASQGKNCYTVAPAYTAASYY
jgi:translation elongation factor EF-4